MNKEDIIKFLSNNDVDQYRIDMIYKILNDDMNSNIIESVYNIINKDHLVLEKFSSILENQYNINSIGIEQIEKILYQYDINITNNTINNILNNKLSIDNILSTSLKDVKFIQFNSILYEDIAKDLYNIKWSGIGKGEILLCLILENAKSNTYKRGDILINDKIIEVKSKNSKLVNQSDFASGDKVSKYWINMLRKHPLIDKTDILRGHNNPLRWNLSRNNNFLNHYIDVLLNKNVSISDLANIICSGWDKMFVNVKMNRSPIRKILKKYKTLNGDAFAEYTFEIFLYNMTYYIEQSNIDYIALTSNDGFYMLDKSFFSINKDKLREFSKNNFMYKYPSLTKNASSGRVFSISLLEG